MQLALIALSFPDRQNLSKLHHSCHFLELKPIHANWASAALWLVDLAGRGKSEVSCQLLFAQAARFPRAVSTATRRRDCVPKQLHCFLRDYHLGRGERLPRPATCAPLSPHHHHHSSASTWKGSFRQQRAAVLWREQDGRWDSSWSQKKGFRRCYLCLYWVKWYLLHFKSLSKPSHPTSLRLLCCDHIAALGDKKAFSSATELFYYLKRYLNLTIKYSCEFIPDCRN